MWLEDEQLSSFLVTRAALVQRSRELLPPEVSRFTIDRDGQPSHRPVAIFRELDKTNGGSSKEEKQEWDILVWRSRPAWPWPTGTQPTRTRVTLSGLALNQNGLHILTNAQVRHTVVQVNTGRWTPDPLDGIFILVAPGRTVEWGTQPAPSRTSAPPDWPKALFAESVDEAFASASRDFDRFCVDPHDARSVFDRALNTTLVEPAPLAEDAAREFRRKLQTRAAAVKLPENGTLRLEALPFYKGFDLVWHATEGEPAEPALVITASMKPEDPIFERASGYAGLEQFERHLRGDRRLLLDRTAPIRYARLRLSLDGVKLVETDTRLPAWLNEYGDLVPAGLAKVVARPLATVRSSIPGSVFVGISEQSGVLGLEICRVHHTELDRVSHPLVVDPTHAYPTRSGPILELVGRWQVAAGVHHPNFDNALNPYTKSSLDTPSKIWQQLRAPISGQAKVNGELRIDDAEYHCIRQQLAVHEASIALPEERGTGGIEFSRKQLPFYDGYSLYKAKVHERLTQFVARQCVAAERNANGSCKSPHPKDSPLVVLNGTRSPIETLNKTISKSAVKIDGTTASQYLRFYGENIQAQKEAFCVIECVNDFAWRPWTELTTQKALNNIVRPVLPVASGPARETVLLAFVRYGQEVGLALFEVSTSGGVRVLDTAYVLAGLPVYPHALNQEATFAMRA